MTTDQPILAPTCPGCDAPPMLAMTGQYWCGNDACAVLIWNPYDEPARFKATAHRIQLNDQWGQL